MLVSVIVIIVTVILDMMCQVNHLLTISQHQARSGVILFSKVFFTFAYFIF